VAADMPPRTLFTHRWRLQAGAVAADMPPRTLFTHRWRLQAKM